MKRHRNQFDRRRFLQLSSTLAACGLAATAKAAASDTSPLIDTNVYLGHWPLRRLSVDTPAKLVTALRENGVTQAWAGTFDGLFHKDVQGVNSRLVKMCSEEGGDLLIPIGTVNPTLPDWEEDIRRCHETFKMPGIRLHPTYHGYALGDPRFARLLELATAGGLFVQLVVQLADKQRPLLTPRILRVDLAPLTKILQSFHGLRLLISNPVPTAYDLAKPMQNDTRIYFEFARTSHGPSLRRVVDRVSTDRIVYGSTTPLVDITLSRSAMQRSGLTDEQITEVCSGNAERLRSSRERKL